MLEQLELVLNVHFYFVEVLHLSHKDLHVLLLRRHLHGLVLNELVLLIIKWWNHNIGLILFKSIAALQVRINPLIVVGRLVLWCLYKLIYLVRY